METEYKYDSKTIWTVTLQYLFSKQVNALLIACALPIIFVIQLLKHDVNFTGYLSILTPLIWLFILLTSTQKRVSITRENKNNVIRIFINGEAIITHTAESKFERKWSNFKELIFLKDYLLLIEKATLQHIIIPRKDKNIEDLIISYISKAGGYVPSAKDIKTSKRITRRLAIVIGIFLTITLLLMNLGNSPEWANANQATTEMENVIRHSLEKKVKIYPSFDKTIGKTTIKKIVTIINSDSVGRIDDTLRMEWSILKVIDSLVPFAPESYVFGYEKRKSISTETFYRYYSPEQTKKIIEELKEQER